MTADHLTAKKRLIAAGKQMNMCQPSGKVTQNTMQPLHWDKGVILLYEKTCSPFFHTADITQIVVPLSQLQHNCNQCNKRIRSVRSPSNHILQSSHSLTHLMYKGLIRLPWCADGLSTKSNGAILWQVCSSNVPHVSCTCCCQKLLYVELYEL